jgi:hypothetical protein
MMVRRAGSYPRVPPCPPPDPCDDPVPPELFEPVEPYFPWSFPALRDLRAPSVPLSCPPPGMPCLTFACPLPVLVFEFVRAMMVSLAVGDR